MRFCVPRKQRRGKQELARYAAGDAARFFLVFVVVLALAVVVAGRVGWAEA